MSSHFKDDLISAMALHIDMDLWRKKCKNETVTAEQIDIPTKALSFVGKDYFPNIYVPLVKSGEGTSLGQN